MQSGRLRDRITIQQLVAGSPQQKSTGEPDTAWTALATVWAEVRPLAGRELFLAQAADSKVEVEMVIRYRSDVTAAMRVVFDSVNYSIEAVVPDQKKTRLALRCSVGMNEG